MPWLDQASYGVIGSLISAVGAIITMRYTGRRRENAREEQYRRQADKLTAAVAKQHEDEKAWLRGLLQAERIARDSERVECDREKARLNKLLTQRRERE